MVSSARISKFAIVPAIPLSGQSGCRVRNVRSKLAAGIPVNFGGAIAAAPVSQSAKWFVSSIVPPSTRTTPPIALGCRAASSRTTLAPQL